MSLTVHAALASSSSLLSLLAEANKTLTSWHLSLLVHIKRLP